MSDLSTPPAILLKPPIIPKDRLTQNWYALRRNDPVLDHIETVLWDQNVAPQNWLVARLSPAVYVYCEDETKWKIVAKFHVPKNGKDAGRHADREFRVTKRAREYLISNQGFRAVQPLAASQGALFLEYVGGITLEDTISIRRSQPGELIHSLEAVGKLLSNLHVNSCQKTAESEFGSAIDYSHKILNNLVKHGVLQNHQYVQAQMERLIERWNRDQTMRDYQFALKHGDATSSNFIFPPQGGTIAIDWERSDFGDPAADLGRLKAEIIHAINQHGGDFSEGHVFGKKMGEAYCRYLPPDWDQKALLHRAQFYEAISTLRIARNGWLSRQKRLALILQAFALLSSGVD